MYVHAYKTPEISRTCLVYDDGDENNKKGKRERDDKKYRGRDLFKEDF